MMDASDPLSKIDYPKQTGEWGRSLIDVLNAQFNLFQKQFDGVNKNISDLKIDIDKLFENLEKSMHPANKISFGERFNNVISRLQNVRF